MQKSSQARSSIHFSPCSNRRTTSANSGSIQRRKARFEQLPVRIQASGTGVITQEPSINEIFVLADYDSLLFTRVLPDYWVVGSMKSQIKDVGPHMTTPSNPSGQR